MVDMGAASTRLDDFYVVTKLPMDVKKSAESQDNKENKGPEEMKEDEGLGEDKSPGAGTRKGKGTAKERGKGKGKKKDGGKGEPAGNGEAKGCKKAEKGKAPKITVKEEKDIVHVKDIKAFVDFIIKERKLDPSKTVVRIGLDGGQDSFKIVASIFDDASDEVEEDGDEADSGDNLRGKSLNTGFIQV